MELKELFKLVKKDIKYILIYGVGFMLSGAFLFFYYPKQYNATGSFLVLRQIKPFDTEFSYEGYYASQTSVNYAQSFASLLQSYDIRSKALGDLGISVNEQSLRKAGRNIKIKKLSPQVITLTISSTDRDFSYNFWNRLSENAIYTSSSFNGVNGDPSISIARISEAPIVYEGFRDIYLYMLIGLFLGTSFRVFISALKKTVF